MAGRLCRDSTSLTVLTTACAKNINEIDYSRNGVPRCNTITRMEHSNAFELRQCLSMSHNRSFSVVSSTVKNRTRGAVAARHTWTCFGGGNSDPDGFSGNADRQGEE